MFIDLKELFERDDVKCPSFLENEKLMEELSDSEYSLENGVHTWKYKDEFKDIKITFDGETYIYLGFDEEGNEIYRKEINSEEGFIT
jgi:hypothetical protein